MAVFPYPVWRWMATVATVVWGIGIEPKCLTDRTQMCFTIIPLQGAQGYVKGDRQVARRAKRRRANLTTQVKEGTDES